jgi:hypothetical protein
MAKPYSDEEIQSNRAQIASPVKRVVASDGRAVEFKDNDDLIKGDAHMVNANRASSGSRPRQIRLMSSKGL